MLRIETVKPATLALLKSLMAMPELADFSLVGGTSLSLQLGHRISDDLDLFTAATKFRLENIPAFVGHLGEIGEVRPGTGYFGMQLDGVKLDFVEYPYALLEPPLIEDGIRLVGLKDIAAMKLNAVGRRAAKKDFVDIYFLLRHFSVHEMLQFFGEKFGIEAGFHIKRSLVYFDEAEVSSLPKIFEKVSWDTIKQTIERHARPFF